MSDPIGYDGTSANAPQNPHDGPVFPDDRETVIVSTYIVEAMRWECPECGHHNLVPMSESGLGVDSCEECHQRVVRSCKGHD